jgi:hypothetical protein
MPITKLSFGLGTAVLKTIFMGYLSLSQVIEAEFLSTNILEMRGDNQQ